ncbi:MAG: pyrroline-5-carboxylate reductase [Candidatus Omnitrophica bacterium]|nr:pyrroline-5-carboxylate reductase [Candidatus Omnitrophota bacterium]
MKIGFIGCGNMGEAILAAIHKKHACFVCEPRLDRLVYLRKKYRANFGMLSDVARVAEVIILAVKPQDLPDVFAEIRKLPLKKKVIVSIAAGITTKLIEQKLGGGVRVIRVMPNLPAMVGEGVSALSQGKKATPKDLALAKGLFETVGTTVIVQEKMMNAVTAVSGSGPAYVFLFVESLMKAARKLGFQEKDARILVGATLLGSMHMLAKGSDSAETLRARVTSKGGTTQAATDVFMEKDIMGIFEQALKAARDRAQELSR